MDKATPWVQVQIYKPIPVPVIPAGRIPQVNLYLADSIPRNMAWEGNQLKKLRLGNRPGIKGIETRKQLLLRITAFQAHHQNSYIIYLCYADSQQHPLNLL
jgi:hypothetical protein